MTVRLVLLRRAESTSDDLADAPVRFADHARTDRDGGLEEHDAALRGRLRVPCIV